MHNISPSLIALSSLGRPSSALVTAHLSSADVMRKLTSKLYPASIFPIAIQNILWARTSLTLCPRGVAVGSIAQTLSILIAVPLVAVTHSKLADGPTRSFISVDWLHGIEQLLMAVPNHVMTSSMRQSVAALDNGKPLPVRGTLSVFSALQICHYKLMCTQIVTLFPSHFISNQQSDMLQQQYQSFVLTW